MKKIKLSDYVRERAYQKGLSSLDVSKKAKGEISASYLNDIVNEKTTNPTVKNLQTLALALGVSEDEIFRVARGLPLEPVENPEDVELIIKFHRLSISRQREVLALLDFYDSYNDDSLLDDLEGEPVIHVADIGTDVADIGTDNDQATPSQSKKPNHGDNNL